MAVTETNELMTDAELCKLLRISLATFKRHMKAGPPLKRHSRNVTDIRNIRNIQIGGQRRWARESVMKTIMGS